MKNNWYVITGGPCSGKTTTISLLQEKGYKVTHEVARAYYESQMKLGLTNEQIKANPQKLQDGIARLLVDLEHSLDSQDTIFLDRGIPDNYAYYEYWKVSPPHFLENAYNSCVYKKVFYLDRLPVEIDEVRVESEEQIRLLAELALKYYKQKKANIVRVPVMDQDSRIAFILRNIDESTP